MINPDFEYRLAQQRVSELRADAHRSHIVALPKRLAAHLPYPEQGQGSRRVAPSRARERPFAGRNEMPDVG